MKERALKILGIMLQTVFLFTVFFAIVLFFGRRWLRDGMPTGDFAGTVAYIHQLKQTLGQFGYVPIWCSRWFAGGSLTLLFASYGFLVFYLPFVWLMPVAVAVKIATLFYLAVSGLGVYWLVKYLFKSQWVAFFAAIAYMLHPINISMAVGTGHANFPPFYALAPLGFLFAFRLIESCCWRDFVSLAMITALQIWVDAERAFVILPFVFLACQMLIILKRYDEKIPDIELKAKRFWQKEFRLTGSLLVGILLCSWSLLPAAIEKPYHALFAEELRISSAKYFSLQNPFYLFDRDGFIVSRMAKYLPLDLTYNSGNYYLSAFLLALTCFGLLFGSRRTISSRYLVIFFICVLTALLCSNGYYSAYEGLSNVVGKLMTNSYYHHDHPYQLPVLALMIVLPPSACICFLLWRHCKKGKPVSIKTWILSGIISAIIFFTKPFEWILVFTPFYKEMRSPSWFASAMPALGIAVAAGAVLAWIVGKSKKPAFKWLLSLAFCGIFVLDIWPYHKGFNHIFPKERTDDLKTVSLYLADQPDNNRVLARETYTPLTDTHIIYSDKPSAFSWLNWDSPKYYGDFILNSVYAKLHRLETINTALAEAGIANIEYLIYDLVEGPPPPQTENLELACETGHYLLYKNKLCRPYVQAYPARITDSSEIKPDVECYSEDIAKVQDLYRKAPGCIEFEIELAEPAAVMISESWYPGWKVKVDGKQQDIIRLQKAFMAVELGSGIHNVTFYYDKPFYYYGGYIITILSTIILLAGRGVKRFLCKIAKRLHLCFHGCRIRYTLLVLIILASCIVHYWKLPSTPRWYGDECNHALWARNISSGDWTIGPRANTSFTGGFSYGFHLLCNASFWLFGKNLLAVRFITATSAVICTLLLYLTLKELGFGIGAYLGAFAWNAHALSVNFSRWGFTHDVAGAFILGAFLFLIKANKHKKYLFVCLASLLIGLSITMTYWLVPLAAALTVILLVRYGRKAILPVIIMAAPVSIFAGLGTIIWGYELVLSDIVRLIGSPEVKDAALGSQGIVQTLNQVFSGYLNVLSVDWYTILGTIGLFFLRKKYYVLLASAIVFSASILPVLSGGEYLHTFFYRAMTFCSLLFVGFGAIFDRVTEVIRVLFRKFDARILKGIVIAGVTSCLVLGYAKRVYRCYIGIDTPIDIFCADNVNDTKDVAAFLNDASSKDGFIIASPMVCHALDSKSVVPKDVASFLAPINTDYHFVHDLSLDKAEFLVVDRLFYTHTLPYDPGCLKLAWTIECQKWPLVWKKGEYRVYRNPKAQPAKSEDKYYRIGVLEFYKRLAADEIENGRYTAAVSCLQQALFDDPNNVEVMNLLAVSLARQSKFKEAVDWFDRALEISPGYENALINKKAVMLDREKSEQ